MNSFRLMAGAALAMAVIPVARVSAAESYDNCTGYIDSLPATISTQGTWCLRKDLATAMASGTAVAVLTNNVTIDCNDFKIGGLLAGPGSTADGVASDGRVNTTVRRCGIRGFNRGVALLNGSGHLVEHNRLDQNLRYGIFVTGENNLVRGNRVYDTGGMTGSANARGISAWGDIIDNTVSGVFATSPNGYVYGMHAFGNGTVTRGNIVRGVVSNGEYGVAIGLSILGDGHRIEHNHFYGAGATAGSIGMSIGGTPQTFCVGNSVKGFQTAASGGCYPGGDNLFN